MQKVAVVVPAYKEQDTIVEAMTRLIEVLESHNYDFRIVLVVDGEVDETAERASILRSEHLIVHSYKENRGKGFALLRGLELVYEPLTVFFDADLDLDPQCIPSMLENIQSGFADAVVGSKVHRNSIVNYPKRRRIQSHIMRLIVHAMFGLSISDTQTGAKAFRTASLKECAFKVESVGFAFDVDLLVRLHNMGQRIMEHPVRIDYQFSTSTGLLDVIEVLRDLLKIRRNAQIDR